jgi:hypothetical protein
MSTAPQIGFSNPSAPSPASPAGAVRLPPQPASLDDLAALRPAQLAPLYSGARTPVLRDMDGPLVGRMLAVGVLPRWMFAFLCWFAGWRRFPWRGKTFKSGQGGRGEGINRVFGDKNPRQWFRFETFVAPSRAGDFDAVQLDYDNPGNPGFIRAIKDEVREVAPGLYLGLAYLMWRGRPRLMLYFGLHKR